MIVDSKIRSFANLHLTLGESSNNKLNMETDKLHHELMLSKFLFFTFIYVPFLVYCLLILWQDRKQIYVKKRRPMIIVLIIFTNMWGALS